MVDKRIAEMSRDDRDLERQKIWSNFLKRYQGSLRRYVKSKLQDPDVDVWLESEGATLSVVVAFPLASNQTRGNDKGEIRNVADMIRKWLVGTTGQDGINSVPLEKDGTLEFRYPVNTVFPIPVQEALEEMGKWMDLNGVFGVGRIFHLNIFREAYKLQATFKSKVLALELDVLHYKAIKHGMSEEYFKEIVEIAKLRE